MKNTKDNLAENSNPRRRANQKSATLKVLIIYLVFLTIVIGTGFYTNSLVLLASGIHLIADAAGLLISYLATILSIKPASDKHSFGLVRAEVLGALINGVILISSSIWIMVSAIGDLSKPHNVQSGPIILLGIVGLVISAYSLLQLHTHAGKSLNMKANILHLASDSVGWLITIISGLLIATFGFSNADSFGAIIVSIMVIASSWKLLSQTISVLLESTPKSINPTEIIQILQSQSDVVDVHHLHLWNLASDTTALSAHVLMDDGTTLHTSQLKVNSIKKLLKDTYGIDHVTIEIECHQCGDEHHDSEN